VPLPSEQPDDAAEREIEIVLAVQTLLDLTDRQPFHSRHGRDRGNQVRAEATLTQAVVRQARDVGEGAVSAGRTLPTQQEVLGHLGTDRRGTLDHLDPAMDPPARQTMTTARARLLGVDHCLIHPVHPLSPMVVSAVPLRPGRGLRLCLRALTRPGICLMLRRPGRSRQPGVLRLEGCHLPPQERVLLG